MIKILTYIFSLILGLFSTVLIAQKNEEWSLEDCINYAFEHNISLKRQNNSLLIQKSDLQQAKNDCLPSINGSSSFSTNYGRGLSGTTNTYTNKNNYGASYGIGASLDLFSGFEKKHRIKKGEIDLQAILYEIESKKEDISLNITYLYLDIMYAKEKFQIAKENMQIVKKQLEQTKAMVDAGKKPKGDLLGQQSEIAKIESSIVDAENKLIMSYLSLYQLLDIRKDNAFKIEIPSAEKIDALGETMLDKSINYEQIIEARPSIAALKYRAQSAEQDKKIAKSGFFPSIKFNVNVGSSYSSLRYNQFIDNQTGNLVQGDKMSFADQADVNLSESWAISLNIPIFNKFRNRTAVKNATIIVEDMELQRMEQENKLYKDIQQAHANAYSAMKKYNSLQKALVAHEETFRYVSEKYKLGLVNSFDYNQAFNDLTVAKSEMLQAKYEYIFRSKIIAFYKGKPLKF